MLENLFEGGFAEHIKPFIRWSETVVPQLNLPCTLFSADVEDASVLQAKHGLQCQRTLSDAWLAAQQDETSGHKTSAKHAVQLGIAHVDTRFDVGIYLVKKDSLLFHESGKD